MSQIQVITDKTAIGLSLLCAIHCLFLPLALVALPALGSLPLHDESFHQWMLYAVIPTSLFALTVGCKKHKRYQVWLFGVAGLIILVMPLMLGHEAVGETGEKAFTLIGALIITTGHVLNYRLCSQHDVCTDENQAASQG